MAEGHGLRERKKRETRRRIADVAMGLFAQKGFEQVTVAEIARHADVSVNTVFNYFRTKEDLFLDRQEEAEGLLARVAREREPGEPVLAAVRRDFLDALATEHWRYGLHPGAEVFARIVAQSPSLTARVFAIEHRRTELLAETLAEETDAGDLTPWVVAGQLNALIRTLSSRFMQRLTAGEPYDQVRQDMYGEAERAFDLLERGLGDYPGREA